MRCEVPRCEPRELTPAIEPQSQFDRIARLYRWAEYLALGPLLQRTRTALLESVSACRHALLLGEGDGRFLACLLARSPDLQATAVDTSAEMLRLLRRRCERASPTAAARLTATHASALRSAVPAGTDLVVTHFFLDCLSQVEVDRLVERVSGAVLPGTLWLLSDFAVPARPVLREAGWLYIRLLYAGFRLLTGLRVQTLPNPQRALAGNGFRCLVRKHLLFGLLYSELWVLDAAGA